MNLVMFGCSHVDYMSINLSKSTDFKDLELKVGGHVGGNSNDKIIDDVYNFVNKYEMPNTSEFKIPYVDLNDVVLYIQYTYTNRLWLPSTLNSSRHSFHGMYEDSCNIYTNNRFASKELLNFYETYIKYFWDYNLNLFKLLQQVELLQTFLKNKNIKFIQSFWTHGGNTNEWRGISNIASESNDSILKYIDDILNKIDYIKPYNHDTIFDGVESEVWNWPNAKKYDTDGHHYSFELYDKIFREIIYPKYLEFI
jgi:hypothetical protein